MPAPSPAEIEPVEMRDLAVRTIGDRRRLEQRCRLLFDQPRQEPIEPGQEGLRRQQAPHALGLYECRGLEIVATRPAPGRAIDIPPIPARTGLPQAICERVV